MSAFRTARFYELLGNPGGRLEREGNFLLEAPDRAPVKRVADLACGLGLHSLFLAEHDAEVFASDLSETMIQYARETRAHPRITYVVGDMCAPVGGPFGLALCLGNSLSLLPNNGELQKFFAAVSSVLAPGGLLITQTLNYEADTIRRPRIRVERASVDDGDIAAVKRFFPEVDSTLLSITYFAATATAFMETTETMRLRHWSAEMLLDAAQQAALEKDAVYGGYNDTPLQSDSSDIILVVRKPL